MKLSKGTYFFQVGEQIYLRNVWKRQDYLFNGIVGDILTYYSQERADDLEGLMTHLLQFYAVEDKQEFAVDMCAFTQQLMDEGILVPTNAEPLKADSRIRLQIQQEFGSRQRLYYAAVELTYRCNERCVHCYIDDADKRADEPELELKDYQKLFAQLREMGCVGVLITGGEVCVKTDFLEIVHAAVDEGLLVDVYTNGTMMTEEELDALKDMNINSLSFSLYSGKAEVHDRVTGVPGSFEKTLRMIMMTKCAGIDTCIKNVAIRQNVDELESLYQLGKRLGVHVSTVLSVSVSHLGDAGRACRLKNVEAYKCALKVINRYAPRGFEEGAVDMDAYPCGAGMSTLSIDPFGGVHPCLAFEQEIGSVKTQSLREIWENNPALKTLRKIRRGDFGAACSTCCYAPCCTVCIGDSLKENSGKLEPCQDTCLIARAEYENMSEKESV